MLKTICQLSVNGYISGKGEVSNEDSVYSSDNFLVVVDGATGLNGIHLTDKDTDAAWLSQRLCGLLSEWLPDTGSTVPEILKRAAAQIKSELDEMGYDRYDNSYPSAGAAIARLNKDTLECFSLGDVPVIVTQKDNSLRFICDGALSARDDKVIEEMKQIHERTGCTVAQARRQVNDILLKNRLEMNQEGAYYCFEPTGAGIDFITHEDIPIEDIANIALMSDGFYAAVSCFKIISNKEELMRQLADGKANDILNSLKSLAYADNDLNRFPRFKIMDDASVIAAKPR